MFPAYLMHLLHLPVSYKDPRFLVTLSTDQQTQLMQPARKAALAILAPVLPSMPACPPWGHAFHVRPYPHACMHACLTNMYTCMHVRQQYVDSYLLEYIHKLGYFKTKQSYWRSTVIDQWSKMEFLQMALVSSYQVHITFLIISHITCQYHMLHYLGMHIFLMLHTLRQKQLTAVWSSDSTSQCKGLWVLLSLMHVGRGN